MNVIVGVIILIGLIVVYQLISYKKKNIKYKNGIKADLPDFSKINEACGRDITPLDKNKSIYKRGCADNKGLNL